MRRANGKPQILQEILATGVAEGLSKPTQAKMAAISYRADKYKRTWQTLIPWEALKYTNAEDEAASIIQTVEEYLQMTESELWPQSPISRKKRRR